MIRYRRKELGLKLSFVAEMIGISSKDLFEYEFLIKETPKEVLEKLAKAYGVEVSDFKEDTRTHDEKEIEKLINFGRRFNEEKRG